MNDQTAMEAMQQRLGELLGLRKLWLCGAERDDHPSTWARRLAPVLICGACCDLQTAGIEGLGGYAAKAVAQCETEDERVIQVAEPQQMNGWECLVEPTGAREDGGIEVSVGCTRDDAPPIGMAIVCNQLVPENQAVQRLYADRWLNQCIVRLECWARGSRGKKDLQ
jgi:hypothetical protein